MKRIVWLASLLLLTANMGLQAAEQPAEEPQAIKQVTGKCPICIEEDIVLDAQLNCGHQFSDYKIDDEQFYMDFSTN